MSTDFLWKAMQATRWWINIFKVPKEKKNLASQNSKTNKQKIFQKGKLNKVTFRHIKAERINHSRLEPKEMLKNIFVKMLKKC